MTFSLLNINWLFLLLAVIIESIVSYNFDTLFPIVYKNPENVNIANDDRYFGYTVALYQGNTSSDSWLQVSAPRDRSIDGLYRSGAIYRCKLLGPCQRLTVESVLTRVEQSRESRDDQWLGVSMDVDVANKRDVVCTHKYIIKPSYYLPGKCYWSNLDNNYERLRSLYDSLHGNHIMNDAYYYSYGQGGIAAHFVTDGAAAAAKRNETSLLIGAPGVYNWQGTVLMYEEEQIEDPQISRLTAARRTRQSAEAVRNGFYERIVDPRHFGQYMAFSFTGYSLTSGRFFDRTARAYVAGSPAFRRHGRITIFDEPYKQNVRMAKEGEQTGEYFGASLAAGDVNGDGYDDLIVGAPFHTTDDYNEGRVVVYFGGPNGLVELPDDECCIVGRSAGEQFGSSVAFLGDIDEDGFNEVAISSPYANDGTGVVYVYTGGKRGLNADPVQRLVGNEVSPSIAGFGASLSKAYDVDGNGYRDLAVGAFRSGHVVLFRSRPVVRLEHYLETARPKYKIGLEQRRFVVRFCLKFTGKRLPPTIEVRRTLIVDSLRSRAFLTSANVTETKRLTRDKKHCEDVNVTLRANIVEFYEPIVLQLSQTLTEYDLAKNVLTIDEDASPAKDPFCRDCVFQDKTYSRAVSTLIVPFVLNCGNDDKCESAITIATNFTNLPNNSYYVIGSQDHVRLEIKLRNAGEKAFFVRASVQLPESVDFRIVPGNCEQDAAAAAPAPSRRFVTCFLSSFLLEEQEKGLTLDLSMGDVRNGTDLTFNVTSLTASVNLAPSSQLVRLPLIREADVTVTGDSGEQSYYVDVRNGTKRFLQTFQVQKYGASPIDVVRIDLWIPIRLAATGEPFLNVIGLRATQRNQPINCRGAFINYTQPTNGELDEDGKRVRRQIAKPSEDEVYPSNRTFHLNCTRSAIVCTRISCVAGGFDGREDDVGIELDMRFVSQRIYDLLGEKDIIVIAVGANVSIESPVGFQQTGHRADRVQVRAVFVKEIEKKSTLWIFVLSVIVGFLLLILIVFGLYKAGFFKRAKREELAALKREKEIKSGGEIRQDDEIVADLRDDQVEEMIMDEPAEGLKAEQN